MKMIKFFVDREPRYIVGDKVYTQDEVDEMKRQTAEKDFNAGYKDRMAGYYDKWYRYNRGDDGAAYDKGQQEAIKNPKCSGEMTIIPCMTLYELERK